MKNEKIIAQLLETIELVNQHIQAVMAAKYCIQHHGRRGTQIDENITDELYQMELDAWRSVFMFGLTLPDRERERIKAAAYERFLSDKSSVGFYLNGGTHASSWSCADEDQFRSMCRELFAPKEEG